MPRQHAAMQGSDHQAVQLSEAYRHCLTIAEQHYENFPTASRLIRRDLRPAVAAIYAFARHADDLADEGDAPPEMRIKQIDAWETLLERCETDAGIAHPVFMALGDSIRKHKLPTDELHNLLVAFRMDVSLHAYASLDELMFYCRHSANPIGRLVLALHGITDPEALHLSDKICTALQLANFWQDLSIDLPRGRCYLPEAWLAEAGMTGQQLLHAGTEDLNIKITPALEPAIESTRQLLLEGSALLPLLPFRLRLQIAATLKGGHLMLEKISRLGEPLNQRCHISSMEWKTMALPILATALFPSLAPEKAAA